ncbi:hypothetical protein HPB48_010109 [Haemaphysalis longicornis]|uniref:Ig-like domain-containing protein n=1 Tax=Haemaphysalis longicornis TaxID=44386 RepID=A0A9J6FBY4_HAELO|nr:hypothetical protein HPB48_010109 [Haemaphysalis longicornis]
MVSRVPVSAVWYHVPTSATMRHGGQHHYGNSHSRKVYGLVAPTPSSTAVGEFSLVDGDHWKQRSWTGRAFFSLLSDPPALRLNKLQREDTGNYFCNVTYLDNATSPAVVLTEAHAELFVAGKPHDQYEHKKISVSSLLFYSFQL